MTKELEEILEYLIDTDKYIEDYGYQYKRLSLHDTCQLLDYIINLQQKYDIAQKDIESLKNNYNDLIKMSENKIDNLQQENEKLKYNARGQVNDYFKDKYSDEVLKNAKLKEENEFLKLNNPEMNIEHFRIVKENKRKIDNLRKENEELNRMCELYSKSLYNAELTDYKSRCKKAIEYIDEHTLFVNGGIIKNILNGSDENDSIINNSDSNIYSS